MAKPALGKGLAALISKNKGTDSEPDPIVDLLPGEQVLRVPIDQVQPSPLQPRKKFPSGTLDELTQSISQLGIIQPLIVRKVGEKYELVAGERRWRASRELKLDSVPVIERRASDQEVLELALIENLQRQDLNAIEEASGYVRLAREFGMKQDAIASRVGKSRASVANAMRLLDLQGPIQAHVADGHLTVGHAKAILGVKDPAAQNAAADQILRTNMTVRQAERFIKELNSADQEVEEKSPKEAAAAEMSQHTLHLQNKLRNHFSTHVHIKHGDKKGKIELEYYGSEDLGRILNLLGVSGD